MKPKKLVFGDDVRKGLAQGISKVNRVVATTLGPSGKLVLIGKEFGPGVLSKDGIACAKEIVLEDLVEEQGARLVISVSSRTNENAGDGTTSSCVIANALVQEGIKYVSAGGNANDVKKGIDLAVERVVEYIQEQSTPVRDIQSVKYIASIAGNSEKIGDYIAEAVDSIGIDGIITLEESQTGETVVEVQDGVQFDRGYLSANFVNVPEKSRVEYDDPIIVLMDYKLESQMQIVDLLNKLKPKGRPVLIMAEEVKDDALSMLTLNKIRGVLQCCAVRNPGFGNARKNILKDVATLVGAVVISKETGMSIETATFEDCGSARRVIIEKESTTILEGRGDKTEILGRIEQLKIEAKQAQSTYEKEQIQKRLASLSGGVAVIKVGGATESEVKETKLRVEDAICATRAAVEEGMVCGGGVTLFRAADCLSDLKSDKHDIQIGINIVRDSLKAPLVTIANNAGKNGEVIAAEVAKTSGNFGYNAATDEVVDLFNAGVVDATKVVRNVIQNASSIASLVLMTDCIIGLEPEESKIDMMF